MRSYHHAAIWVLALAGSGCQRGTRPTPQFLNESAKQDLDKASLVVLANVKTVSDSGMPSGPAGYRLIRVALEVRRVIKGELDDRTPCVNYFALHGGFVGQLPVWVEPGSTGVFFLAEASPCFRAVNDSRTYIEVYSSPPMTPASPEKFVARATLPRGCAGNSYISKAAQDVWSVTIPLVGPRAARNLLLTTHDDANVGARDCSCLVAATVWKLSESCLAALPIRDGIREQARGIKATNDKLNLGEEQRLRGNPAIWLQTTVEELGMDGALLRMGGLMSRSGSPFSEGTCAVLKAERESASFGASLSRGRDHSNAKAESAAIKQFGQWLGSGCRPEWQLLENPEIDP
jgi:hypothetical protein